MVCIRLDRRLQGRVDESDVVQETLLEVTRRMDEYLRSRTMPFYLWMRQIAGQKLIDIHRQHLGTRMRNVGRELSLHRGPFPAASSISLAAQLLGHITSPSQAVVKAEARDQVQEALNKMDELDREVLALRHFEQLSNGEIAEVLGLTESGATARYVRALRRLKKVLSHIPGLF
jgi:RNA polymerase sigma-70 factor (ECF subfamily)